MKYKIIVVGAGHAGCEAALASARIGHKTLLITGNYNNIATMPCNPSIGGSAKGIIVREIDALGGEMGVNADKTLIQMKMLNSSKGPAVRSLRAQADKVTYPKEMTKTLESTDNLEIKEALVEDLIIENNKIYGVILENGEKIESEAVILTTGTYLKSDILIGSTRTRSGPHGEKPSNHLSDKLKEYGFKILRLKTGTPPRIERSTIDFTKTKLEEGNKIPYTFSHDIEAIYDVNNQIPCHLIYTTPLTHKIINDNLSKSSMYGGLKDITGVGPRYCPSIEDKLVRFKDKPRHLLFLEPESLSMDITYIQGFSTSLPRDIQEHMVHSLPGFKDAIIKKYAYAIEYDAIDPIQMKPTFESKIIENLFTAGQVNGTSGYEEAAGQGIMAGINAVMKLDGKQPLVFARDEAYIGVLVDDLTTKGTLEPYRLLTSRAEFRLLLRHDNAEERLIDKGRSIGLISDERYAAYERKQAELSRLKDHLKETVFEIDDDRIHQYLKECGYDEDGHRGINGLNLVKRPNIETKKLFETIGEETDSFIASKCDIDIKYAGYIDKARREASKLKAMDSISLGVDFNYDEVDNLSIEGRQKLMKYKPATMGQASRISGVNPADLAVLAIAIKQGKGKAK